MEIPRIEYEALMRGDADSLTKLNKGVCETGFIVLRCETISSVEIESLLSQYRAFFHEPADFKNKYDMSKTGSNRGWGRSKGEQVNPLANPDYKEFFDVGVEFEHATHLQEITYYAPNLWPAAEGFREQTLGYYNRAFDVSMNLLSLIARTIDLPDDFFEDKFDPPMALLRANYYPPRPKDAGAKDFGIAAHTDYGCLTLLTSDGTSGLEVQLKDGRWENVEFGGNTFVINFGEMLESWSNGKVKATPHRVIGSSKERISLPFFFNPAYNTNVAPFGSGETLLAGDYLSRRYDETYVHRKETETS